RTCCWRSGRTRTSPARRSASRCRRRPTTSARSPPLSPPAPSRISRARIGRVYCVPVATTEPPRAAVPAALFSARARADHSALVIPLVRRTREPYLDQWALPVGWLGAEEGLEAAAGRTLAATTGLAPSWLEQLYTFDSTDRSPDPRVL